MAIQKPDLRKRKRNDLRKRDRWERNGFRKRECKDLRKRDTVSFQKNMFVFAA